MTSPRRGAIQGSSVHNSTGATDPYIVELAATDNQRDNTEVLRVARQRLVRHEDSNFSLMASVTKKIQLRRKTEE